DERDEGERQTHREFKLSIQNWLNRRSLSAWNVAVFVSPTAASCVLNGHSCRTSRCPRCLPERREMTAMLRFFQKGASFMLIRMLRRSSAVALAAIVVLACVFSASLQAQNISTAELHGTVHDSSGAVIPNAAITISDASKGFSRATTSNGQGEYQLLL